MKAKIDSQDLKTACANCSVHELCMPVGAGPDLLKKLDELVYIRRRIKCGAVLYHSGSHFHALYAVKSGFLKTENLHDDGRAQITGFYMSGEIFGFDGIATDAHICTSVALEDSEVCVIPLDRVEHFNHGLEELQHHFYKLISREIVRDDFPAHQLVKMMLEILKTMVEMFNPIKWNDADFRILKRN